jgi:hypothetical protein
VERRLASFGDFDLEDERLDAGPARNSDRHQFAFSNAVRLGRDSQRRRPLGDPLLSDRPSLSRTMAAARRPEGPSSTGSGDRKTCLQEFDGALCEGAAGTPSAAADVAPPSSKACAAALLSPPCRAKASPL